MPAEILLGGGILVRARVNGSGPLWFALDSAGGSGFIVDTRTARALRLAPFEHGSSAGAGKEPVPISFARGARIELPGLTLDPPRVALLSLRSLEPFSGRSLDGILGFGLFADHIVEIDYAARRINLYPPAGWIASGKAVAMPLEVANDHVYVEANVVMPGHGRLTGRFMVDTGAPTATLVLNTPFVLRHGLRAGAGTEYVDRSLPGLGGETSQILSRASEVVLGGLRIPGMTLTLSQDEGGTLASSRFDGIIGGELLRRFTAVFDVPGRRLILEPNAALGEPYEHNMSGLGLRAEGEDFRIIRIHRVIRGSPAETAGIREGDEIQAIDGVPSSQRTLDQIYRMFKREGKSLTLATVRRGRSRTARLTLRRLA